MSTALKELARVAALPHGSAVSLPFAAYADAELFEAELDRIFLEDWIFVCAASEIPDAGDYYAFRLGGEPVVVVRSQDGAIRALSNICRHRGTQLLDDGFGRFVERIVCPYHAWAYDDRGQLEAVPFSKEIPVDRETHRLSTFSVSEWHGLAFVNLSEDPRPLAERVAHIEPYLGVFDQGRFGQASSGPIELWDANWKLIMENAMESYHLFKVHTSTLETVTPTRGAYYVIGNSESSLTGGAGSGSSVNDLAGHYLLVSIPPSFVGILDRTSFGWVSAHPVEAGTTVVRSGGLASDLGSFEDQATTEFVRAFFAEDKAICERVQRGMGSVRAKGGQLTDLERVVVDFHRYLASRLFDAPPLPVFQTDRAIVYGDALKA